MYSMGERFYGLLALGSPDLYVVGIPLIEGSLLLSIQVHSVAWNCSGKKLASGSVDQTARIWHIEPHGHVIILTDEWDPLFFSLLFLASFITGQDY